MLEIQQISGLARPDDRVFIFSEGQAVVSLRRGPAEIWSRAEAEASFSQVSTGLPLGVWQGWPCYAIEVAADRINALEHMAGSLYTLFGRVPDAVFAAYGRAAQMLTWQRDHKFCGRCGGQKSPADEGRALSCEACGHSAYPRLNPCVIVAVGRGDELLLAEAAGRSLGFHSTLAGFIEPGETAEEAVVREVAEEVGLQVDNVRYFRSQPWPFPSQLMLGFFADYVSGDIVVDPSEIARAGWYRQGDTPTIPPPMSIAGQLISHFFAHCESSPAP